MILGIVGSEEAKFTKRGRERALLQIKDLIDLYDPEAVCSGGCHLGGVDIWTEKIAKKMSVPAIVHKPKTLRWHPNGYQQRNMLIAQTSDLLVCIAVDKLPEDFEGMRFERCYHCDTSAHVKSGGCWTMKRAKKLGKDTMLIVIVND